MKTKLIIASLGTTVLAIAIFSSVFIVLNNRNGSPSVEGVSIVAPQTTIATPNPAPSSTPTPKPLPKVIKKTEVTPSTTPTPTPVQTLVPTPTPPISQNTQPNPSATSILDKSAACKVEAESKSNEWKNQELAKLNESHPEFYSYEAAVAKYPSMYSSQIDPQGAYNFWVNDSKNLRSIYESDIQSTTRQVNDAYYSQCLSKS